MKKVKRIQRRRVYAEEFKKARVKEYESGQFTVSEIGKLYSIGTNVIYRWIHKYSKYNSKKVILVEQKDSASQRLKEFSKRIEELERMVGQKQIRIDFLEKMIDIARDDYGMEIKKNLDTPQSNGLETIKDK